MAEEPHSDPFSFKYYYDAIHHYGVEQMNGIFTGGALQEPTSCENSWQVVQDDIRCFGDTVYEDYWYEGAALCRNQTWENCTVSRHHTIDGTTQGYVFKPSYGGSGDDTLLQKPNCVSPTKWNEITVSHTFDVVINSHTYTITVEGEYIGL